MSTDQRTIDAYNEFAKKGIQYGMGVDKPAHTFLEKPHMRDLIRPYIHGARVLCLGCGTGEECQMLKEMGAGEVVGIDISSGLIDLAKKHHNDIHFLVGDMENLPDGLGEFDLVYSSLTMHYVNSRGGVLENIDAILSDMGRYFFSCHHPIKRGSQVLKTEEGKKSLLGYEKEGDEQRVYGNYLAEQKLDYTLPDGIQIQCFNRPISSLLEDIRNSNFELIDFKEPKPITGGEEKFPLFYELYSRIPIFLIFHLAKNHV